jgi:hypothetical protein
MTDKNQNFSPRLMIIDHFDDIINQIDIKTEALLESGKKTSKDSQKKLNDLREKLIEKIKELKELNLSHLPENINEEKYAQKWAHVIDDKSLDYKQKADEIKEELILVDCVLLENPDEKNDINLWITAWFHNEKSVAFLK